MSVTAEHIERMSKDDLSSHHHKLLDLFLMALDYRAVNYQVIMLGSIIFFVG